MSIYQTSFPVGKCDEVDMLLHHLKRITKLTQLGDAFLVGKQTLLDLENRSATWSRCDATAGSFFDVPLVSALTLIPLCPQNVRILKVNLYRCESPTRLRMPAATSLGLPLSDALPINRMFRVLHHSLTDRAGTLVRPVRNL